MKKTIIHLSSRYSSFGTFVSSERYFKYFKNKFYLNYYLTGRFDKKLKSPNIKRLSLENNILTYKINYYIDNLINFFFQKKKTNNYWSNSAINFSLFDKIKKIKKADLIILYWVNDNFLTISQIKKILDLGIPVIWRFSDMWPFTGGCHYSFNCDLYTIGCHKCPQLNKSKVFDLANFNFKKKLEWNLKNLTIIAPSSDMKKKIKQSLIFKDVECLRILNGVNTNFFTQKKIELNYKKKLKILVGPFGKSDFERKGFFNFLKTLNHLNKNSINLYDFEVFGGHIYDYRNYTQIKINNNGFIKNKNKLKKLYQNCDLYLFLSNQDNSPNTVAESLSCGTPIITLTNNGTKDFCINKFNSFLVSKFDILLVNKILFRLYKDRMLLKKISINARTFAENNLNNDFIQEQVISLAKKKLNEY